MRQSGFYYPHRASVFVCLKFIRTRALDKTRILFTPRRRPRAGATRGRYLRDMKPQTGFVCAADDAEVRSPFFCLKLGVTLPTQIFARFFTSVSKNITNRKLSDNLCVRPRVGQLLCEQLATPVRTPRSRSRPAMLVRSIRSHLPIAGSSSEGLSARQKRAGRAATGRRRGLGLAREQNEERAANLGVRVAGWDDAWVRMAIRRPRFFRSLPVQQTW